MASGSIRQRLHNERRWKNVRRIGRPGLAGAKADVMHCIDEEGRAIGRSRAGRLAVVAMTSTRPEDSARIRRRRLSMIPQDTERTTLAPYSETKLDSVVSICM